MDNGEEIPCLNENWSFAGADLVEWIAGFASVLMLPDLLHINAAHSMPLLLFMWLGTTFGLALLRRRFPDERRGVRNFCMDSLGFAPPGIPRPASLQPYWSGARITAIKDETWYQRLDLDGVFREEAKDRQHEREG